MANATFDAHVKANATFSICAHFCSAWVRDLDMYATDLKSLRFPCSRFLNTSNLSDWVTHLVVASLVTFSTYSFFCWAMLTIVFGFTTPTVCGLSVDMFVVAFFIKMAVVCLSVLLLKNHPLCLWVLSVAALQPLIVSLVWPLFPKSVVGLIVASWKVVHLRFRWWFDLESSHPWDLHNRNVLQVSREL